LNGGDWMALIFQGSNNEAENFSMVNHLQFAKIMKIFPLNVLSYRIARNFHRTLFSEISETLGIFQKFFYKMAL